MLTVSTLHQGRRAFQVIIKYAIMLHALSIVQTEQCSALSHALMCFMQDNNKSKSNDCILQPNLSWIIMPQLHSTANQLLVSQKQLLFAAVAHAVGCPKAGLFAMKSTVPLQTRHGLSFSGS